MQQKQQQQSQTQTQTTPISALYPGMNAFKIVARIVQKSQVRTFENKKSGVGADKETQVFSIDICDNDGSQITCSFFNQYVEKYFDTLEVNKVYQLSGGYVKLNNNKYKKNSDYQITFDRAGTITEVEDNGEVGIQKFDFIPIVSIKELQKNQNIDVIGIISEDSETSMVKLKSGEEKQKRTLSIHDKAAIKIEVTFWGDNATKYDFKKGNIICLQGCIVSEFKEVKQISTLNNTNVFINNDKIEGVQELQEWNEQNNNLDLAPIGESQQTGNKASTGSNLVTLRDIEAQSQNLSIGSQIFNSVRAYITYVKQDGKVYYNSCTGENCSKKVVENDGKYICEKHGQMDKCKGRYMTSVKLADSTSFIWVTLFDKQGKSIFPMDADDIKQLVEDKNSDLNVYRDSMAESCHKEYNLTILSKAESYQGKFTIRHQIINILPQNPRNEGLALYQQIEKYLSLDDNNGEQQQQQKE